MECCTTTPFESTDWTRPADDSACSVAIVVSVTVLIGRLFPLELGGIRLHEASV